MSILDRFRMRGRAGAEMPYECRQCGSPYAEQHHVCPNCGGFSVERPEW